MNVELDKEELAVLEHLVEQKIEGQLQEGDLAQGYTLMRILKKLIAE